MDGPGDYYPKCSKSERERLYDIAYMWNLKRKKMIQMKMTVFRESL